MKKAFKDVKERLLQERAQLVEKLKDNDLSVDDAETPDPVDLDLRKHRKHLVEPRRKGAIGCGRSCGSRVPRCLVLAVLVVARHVRSCGSL